MRPARLWLGVFLVLFVGATAVAQDSKTDNQKPPAQQNEANPVNPPAIVVPTPPSGNMQSYDIKINGVPFRAQLMTDPKKLQMMQDYAAQMNGCYVMHTIQVARDEKDSDSTHVVNVTNCTPAKRFEMKSAVATPQQK